MKTLEISENELWTLSFYRESELAGALILGRLAGEIEDDELRARLTEHCAEEAEHARLWTDAIVAVGGLPRRIQETYQSRYRERIGAPPTLLDVLALTHVFERRVVRHFREHLRRPDVHPVVARTLRRMIEDEAGHLGWVRAWLERYAREHGPRAVAAALRRCREVDRDVYAELLRHRDDVAGLVHGGRETSRAAARDAPPDSAVNGPRLSLERAAGGFEEAVRRVLARAVGKPVAAVALHSVLDELGTDSLDLVTVLTDLEDAFQVEIGHADTHGWRTVADVVATVARLAGGHESTEHTAPGHMRQIPGGGGPR